MNSARPMTFGWSRKGSRRSIGRSAPEVSRCVAGTQEESWTRMSMIVFERRIQEELDALGAQHIGDLVRIADRGGDAIGQDAAVELLRGDQRGSRCADACR